MTTHTTHSRRPQMVALDQNISLLADMREITNDLIRSFKALQITSQSSLSEIVVMDPDFIREVDQMFVTISRLTSMEEARLGHIRSMQSLEDSVSSQIADVERGFRAAKRKSSKSKSLNSETA